MANYSCIFFLYDLTLSYNTLHPLQTSTGERQLVPLGLHPLLIYYPRHVMFVYIVFFAK